MRHYTLPDFDGIDSLYRLVYIAAKRVTQVSKPEGRALVPINSRKPTIVALEEVRTGKVGYRTSESDEDDYDVA